MMGRTTQATRQLASRGRRRIRGARTSAAEPDLTRQRAAVDAFFAAGRAGDFDALIAVLHPDVVLRADFSPGRPGRSTVIRGAAAVAHHAHLGVRPAAQIHPALINGTAGVILTIPRTPLRPHGLHHQPRQNSRNRLHRRPATHPKTHCPHPQPPGSHQNLTTRSATSIGQRPRAMTWVLSHQGAPACRTHQNSDAIPKPATEADKR